MTLNGMPPADNDVDSHRLCRNPGQQYKIHSIINDQIFPIQEVGPSGIYACRSDNFPTEWSFR